MSKIHNYIDVVAIKGLVPLKITKTNTDSQHYRLSLNGNGRPTTTKTVIETWPYLPSLKQDFQNCL